jgi:prepilin-type N-terminal cleavage/methylation domain-containing protein
VKKTGFTLIELLAVIAILAFLAVIIVTNISKVLEESRDRAYDFLITEIEVAAQEYMNQNKPLFNSLTPNNPTFTIFLADLIGINQFKSPIIDPRTNKEILLSKRVFVILDQDLNIRYCFEDSICIEAIQVGDTSGANRPVLSPNMIPVKWNGTNWVKADGNNLISENQWYDYNQYMWANAVTVAASGSGTGSDGITRRNRSAYLSANAGTSISMDDILTFFVWIPRYKYAVSVGTGPREINIVFETGNSTTGVGSAVGTDYLTHPAFTFGTNELRGLWVGKFQTSSNITETCYVTGFYANCLTTPVSLKVIPNVSSWRNAEVGIMFLLSRMMQDSGNIYGFPSVGINIHMMKNMEWGAVAYFSHSKYGKFGNQLYNGSHKEIYINNSTGYFTGRSAGAPGGSAPLTPSQNVTSGYYTYDGKCAFIHDNLTPPCNTGNIGDGLGHDDQKLAYGASTTGTIYGIYDMSGNAWEYVMGNFNNIVGNDEWVESGFNGEFGAGGYRVDGIPFPSSQYYDLYTDDINYVGHKGDATNADGTQGWYGDSQGFVHHNSAWFIRGNYYHWTNSNGIFAFGSTQGNYSNNTSYRIVIAP